MLNSLYVMLLTHLLLFRQDVSGVLQPTKVEEGVEEIEVEEELGDKSEQKKPKKKKHHHHHKKHRSGEEGEESSHRKKHHKSRHRKTEEESGDYELI